ncbi:MAG: histidine kinase [Chitinophagaceae bacterium]|nr:histidine kinase [Chitinophagaceae bacterium]MCW5929257.1 histidine kinase [Chitinophagaceae bacterium]
MYSVEYIPGIPLTLSNGYYIRNAVFVLAITAGSVISSVCAQEKEYHIQLYNSSGISADNIVAVVKDVRGFLWILYPRQVERFDGRATRAFTFKTKLENISTDSVGRVWVSSRKKVFYLEDGGSEFSEVTFEGELDNPGLGSFITMGEKVLLISSHGVLQFSDSVAKFEKAFPDLNIPGRYNIRILSSKGDHIFFRNESRIYRYHTGNHRLDSLPDTEAYKLHPFSEDSVLVSTWTNKSYWYNFKSKTINQVMLPGEGTFDVRSLLEYEPGVFFLVCREGLFEYDSRLKTFQKTRFMLNGRKIATTDYALNVFPCTDGHAWLSTIDGVARFSFRQHTIGLTRFRQPDDSRQGGIDNVRKIAGDENGNLWLATANGFLFWDYSGKQQEMFLPSETEVKHPSVRAIAYDGRNIILGPTDSGIWLLNARSKRFSRPAYASEEIKRQSERDYIDDIVTLNNKDHLVLGRDNLYKLSGDSYALTVLDIPPSRENTNYAFQGKNGIIWLTTNEGLHCLDADCNFLQTVPLPFEDKYISSGVVLEDGQFVFATNYGVYVADYSTNGVTLHKFSTVFDNMFLSTIFFDRNGIFWATAENGIYRYDPVSQQLNLFDHYDNVQVHGFNDNNWYRNKDGLVFLGGRNGVLHFTPEKLTPADEKLNVYLTGITGAGNDSLFSGTGKYRFDYAPNATLHVEFVAPYFSNPEKVKYRYRLKGFDDNWKKIGNTQALQFTSLPPGNYTLTMQATTNNVDWVDARNSFSFYIKPPFWRTWWFIAAAVVLAGGGVWKAIRMRNRKLEAQKMKAEGEQAINHFAASLQETNSVRDILWDVAKNCIGRLHFEDCVIYLVDYKRGVLVQKAAYGPKSGTDDHINNPLDIPLGKGITGHVALTGEAEIIKDTTRDPRYIVDDTQRYSEITVPIVYKGKVLGIIDCEHSKRGFFNDEHLSVLTTIASLCANKIVKAKAETEKLKAKQILIQTQKKMADVEMLALRAQMNPHFIFNCLNSINRYIVKSDQVTASLYLTKFAKLIRLILDNSNSKSITLANEIEALKLYIEMELIRFENRFSYSVTIEDEINPENIFVPPLIIQPYVENAIWHGLLHKKTAGELKVMFSLQSGCLLKCVIEDNGIGRDKSKELKSKSFVTKKSLGMKLTQDRLALLSRHAQAEATIEVEDIRDGNEAAGTKVIINIPIDC